MAALKQLAQEGHTVVCSIHQVHLGIHLGVKCLYVF